MIISAAGSIGIRKRNQDSLMVDRFFCQRNAAGRFNFIIQTSDDEPMTMAVCDGACELGDLASMTAIDQLYEALQQLNNVNEPSALRETVDAVNAKICDLLGDGRSTDGISVSTLSMLCLRQDKFIVCNIGDSPIYLLRDGELRRLSQPHTLAELKKCQSSSETVTENDHHILTNYLGRRMDGGFEDAHTVKDELYTGDIFLLCSDGILESVSENIIARNLTRHKGKAAEQLVKKAERNGSTDNISAIAICVE